MKITIRSDSVEIEGYVNAVGRDSRRMMDQYGNEFVEQMQPGVFALALSKNANVQMLLNHNSARVLGDTQTNLELEEDSIGLHARAIVTDPEVIELARADKLVGWSFGFFQLDARTAYDYDSHVERSIVTEIDLQEVSIIDDTMLPVYAGTSVHARAEEKDKLITRALDRDIIRISRKDESQAESGGEPEQRATESEVAPVQQDYTKYHETIERLRRK
ncbi:MAG: HK97 family phage prohead protease [Lachnospiraceae bacterium]|nr:HK97 family phage prohead protease [Lachnospiraceae bacterium]